MRQNEAVPWDNAGRQSDSNVERTLSHVEPTMGGVITTVIWGSIDLGTPLTCVWSVWDWGSCWARFSWSCPSWATEGWRSRERSFWDIAVGWKSLTKTSLMVDWGVGGVEGGDWDRCVGLPRMSRRVYSSWSALGVVMKDGVSVLDSNILICEIALGYCCLYSCRASSADMLSQLTHWLSKSGYPFHLTRYWTLRFLPWRWYDWYLPSSRNFEFYCFFMLFINLHVSELSVPQPTFPHLGRPSPASLYLSYHFP